MEEWRIDLLKEEVEGLRAKIKRLSARLQPLIQPRFRMGEIVEYWENLQSNQFDIAFGEGDGLVRTGVVSAIRYQDGEFFYDIFLGGIAEHLIRYPTQKKD